MPVKKQTQRSQVKTNKRGPDKDGIFVIGSIEFSNMVTDPDSKKAGEDFLRQNKLGFDNFIKNLEEELNTFKEDLDLKDFDINNVEKLSEEWWILSIQKKFDDLQEAIERGDNKYAAFKGVQLGQKLGNYKLWLNEKYIVKGKEFYEDQINKAKKAYKGKHPEEDEDQREKVDAIIKTLVGPEFEGQTAKELWPRFYGMLDDALLDPRYDKDEKEILYGVAKPISFGGFKNLLTKAKKLKNK